jgi:hypothetical protein
VTSRMSHMLVMLSAALLLQTLVASNVFGAEEEAGAPEKASPPVEAGSPGKAGAASEPAPSNPSTEGPAPPPDFISTKNIENKLDEARRPRISLFNFGLRDASLRLEKRLYRATRIRFAGIYTFLYQDASTGIGPRQAGGGDLDIIATWDAIQRGGKTVGALDVALEGRHKAWTEIPPSSLSNTIDCAAKASMFGVRTWVPP